MKEPMFLYINQKTGYDPHLDQPIFEQANQKHDRMLELLQKYEEFALPPEKVKQVKYRLAADMRRVPDSCRKDERLMVKMGHEVDVKIDGGGRERNAPGEDGLLKGFTMKILSDAIVQSYEVGDQKTENPQGSEEIKVIPEEEWKAYLAHEGPIN